MNTKRLLVVISACVALLGGCDSSSSDKGGSTGEKEPEKPAKSLPEREDALFADFMKIGEASKDDCDKMGTDMKALLRKESETVDEINKAFDKMSADEKEAKKKASQARQNKYQGMSVIICSVKNADVKDAGDKIVPATK